MDISVIQFVPFAGGFGTSEPTNPIPIQLHTNPVVSNLLVVASIVWGTVYAKDAGNSPASAIWTPDVADGWTYLGYDYGGDVGMYTVTWAARIVTTIDAASSIITPWENGTYAQSYAVWEIEGLGSWPNILYSNFTANGVCSDAVLTDGVYLGGKTFIDESYQCTADAIALTFKSGPYNGTGYETPIDSFPLLESDPIQPSFTLSSGWTADGAGVYGDYSLEGAKLSPIAAHNLYVSGNNVNLTTVWNTTGSGDFNSINPVYTDSGDSQQSIICNGMVVLAFGGLGVTPPSPLAPNLYNLQTVEYAWNINAPGLFKTAITGGYLSPSATKTMNNIANQKVLGTSQLTSGGTNLNDRYVQSGLEATY